MQRILVLADNLACPMLDRGEGRIGAGRGAEGAQLPKGVMSHCNLWCSWWANLQPYIDGDTMQLLYLQRAWSQLDFEIWAIPAF